MVVISPTQDIVEASSFVNRKPGRMKIFTAFDHLEYETNSFFSSWPLVPNALFRSCHEKNAKSVILAEKHADKLKLFLFRA